MDFEPSAKTKDVLARVQVYMRERILPIEKRYWDGILEQHHGGDWTKWRVPAFIEELKNKAKRAGLWNLFLPDETLGAGLSTIEYAPIAEQMGRSLLAPEVFNCSAPDTGNMEVLVRYGTEEQRHKWLRPLLAGEIRSAFCMTEPDVASSDATNMQATVIAKGSDVIVNGHKWWASGIGHPNAKVAIFMGRTNDDSKDRHHQHTMVLVPLDAKGVHIERMLPVFGEFDEPHGHGEVHFHAVRVPASNVIGGFGMAFEIAQARLGPGRIHHAMRCLGAAEAALEAMIDRGIKRSAFGKSLVNLGGNRERIADLRIAIDQARLLTLYAAWKIDAVGSLAAMTEISAIKVAAPKVLEKVVDAAIQMHGGAGLSRDTPLAAFFAQARALRLADGPDEVHKGVVARIELAKRGYTKG